MTTCPGCEQRYDADELTRHERDGVVHVHCPDCGQRLGTYNEHMR
ncbi:MAG: hypothetical protein ABEJ88_04955 [Halobacterium sp.]